MLAFKEAGMLEKVKEWKHKIKVCEARGLFQEISLSQIGTDLGVEGLQKVLDQRKVHIEGLKKDAHLMAYKIADPHLYNKRFSEAKMWAMFDENKHILDSNPYVRTELLGALQPILHGSIKLLVKSLLLQNDVKSLEKEIKYPEQIQAYVKIDRIDQYQQNDNPPLEVLMKVINSKKFNLFDEFYVAYPMIGPIKAIDPIIFGVIKKFIGPFFNTFESVSSMFVKGNIPFETLKTIDMGHLFKIAEWV